jgi:hypothetical protein
MPVGASALILQSSYSADCLLYASLIIQLLPCSSLTMRLSDRAAL